jgi:hypothetical protein
MAQVHSVSDSLDTSDTVRVVFPRYFEYSILTITLPATTDTVKVFVGTNTTPSKYGQIGVKDMLTYETVQVITGNTTPNRKYLLLYGLRQPDIKLISTTNSAKLGFTLEAY